MRWLAMLLLVPLVAALLVPAASAQVPHPHEAVVHHPLTIQSEMEAIRDKNPESIRMASFGESTLGFPLWYLDFAAPGAKDLPVFYLDANHHGNEQLGMEALLIFLDELADWSLTEEGGARLSEVRVVGAPMINPDGTGRNNRVNTNFVDLNRNYDYNWGLYGTSDMANPVGGNYRGDHAHSEPESAANAAFMEQLKPWVYLSMHTGSHDIVLPWRQTPEADGPIPDWPAYEAYLAEIENASGLGYRDPSGAGESISFAYGALGAISLIVEVDNLQSELIVDGRPERLKEEVAIFWRTIEVFEKIGGNLEWLDGQVCNTGWGNATSVAWSAQSEANVGSIWLNLTGSLPAGECVGAPDGADLSGATVRYARTHQGDQHRPGASLFVPARDPEPADEAEATPLPALVTAAAVALALVLRRRPA